MHVERDLAGGGEYRPGTVSKVPPPNVLALFRPTPRLPRQRQKLGVKITCPEDFKAKRAMSATGRPKFGQLGARETIFLDIKLRSTQWDYMGVAQLNS